jgi:hypothetical protein
MTALGIPTVMFGLWDEALEENHADAFKTLKVAVMSGVTAALSRTTAFLSEPKYLLGLAAERNMPEAPHRLRF